MKDVLLEIRGLKTAFYTKRGVLNAVDGVNLILRRGEILGLVGESGSGKTQTALAIMRLIPSPGKIIAGEILFKGQDLLKLDARSMQDIRGNRIAMIFQDPMAALDPVFTCGQQMVEVIRFHEHVSLKEATDRSLQMLGDVGIPYPENCFRSYPHELSGGMCQRVMIAMSLLCNPDLLIADEPTTALDVTVQAQILDLLRKIRKERDMAILMITHDLGVVSELTDRAAVMYGAKIMEEAPTETLFSNFLHPYTRGLMKAIPRLNQGQEALYTINGTVPGLADMPTGCRFCTRCPLADETCRASEPEVSEPFPGHRVRCNKTDKAQEVI